VDPDDKSFEELKINDTKENIYKKIILKGNTLVGTIFAGDIKNSGVFLRLIREKIDISSVKNKLLKENFGYPDIIDLVKEKEKLYV
jgi:NAD(P)H-nitrite reductase large subunit